MLDGLGRMRERDAFKGEHLGQACQVGNHTGQLVFSGSYVTDAASTGTVANADGIGSVRINTPSGLPGSGINMKASLEGQLIYGN